MSKIQDVVRLHRFIFHIIGLWPCCELSKWHKRLTKIAFLLLVIFPLLLCCFSLLQCEKIVEYVHSVMHIIGYLWAILMFVCLYINKSKIVKFVESLEQILYEDDDVVSFIDESCDQAIKLSKFLTLWVLVICCFGCIVLPGVFGTLPVSMWKPCWANSRPGLFLYSMLQFMSLMYSSTSLFTVYFSFALIMIINGYQQFLSVRLRMLVSTEDHDGSGDLKYCKLVHQKIKQFLNDLQSIFGIMNGFMYKIVIFAIGSCIFVITKGSDQLTFRENSIFYGYILITVTYIFIPSYFGELINSTSSQFLYDLFSSDWVDADMKYKRSMIIFMENLKKPMKLSVLFYDSLNLKLFQDTVNEGYSMYSVFMNLKKKVEG